MALTIDGVTTEYASYLDALAAANNAESAKMTLLADTEGTSDWIYTNLTLDLAGYTLNNVTMSLPNGTNSVLTIEDSSGEGTGRINTLGGIVFSSVYGGQVIINGGSFSDLSVSLVDAYEQPSTLTINDAHADILNLYIDNSGELGSSIEVKGGTFDCTYLSIYNGDIAITGGTYKTMVYGQNDADNFDLSGVIAEDYIMVDGNGKSVFLLTSSVDIPDGEAYSVIYHPTCSYDFYSNEGERGHLQVCSCGSAGGFASIDAHTLGELHYDERGHWNGCVCGYGADDSFAEHDFGKWYVIEAATETETGIGGRACECGYEETMEIAVLSPAPENTTPTNPTNPTNPTTPAATKDKDEGCGSVIGGTLALTVVAAAAVALCKKKEN